MRPIPVILTIDGISQSKAVKHLFPPVVKLLAKPFRLRDLRAIVETALQARAERLVATATEREVAPGGPDGWLAPRHQSFNSPVH